MRKAPPLTLSDQDLAELRAYASADFHARPSVVLALLDLLDEARTERDQALAIIRKLRGFADGD